MNNLLYNNGEKLIIKKKHLEEFLNDSIKIMQENEDLDEEELKYYQEENAQLLKITKDWNEEKKDWTLYKCYEWLVYDRPNNCRRSRKRAK